LVIKQELLHPGSETAKLLIFEKAAVSLMDTAQAPAALPPIPGRNFTDAILLKINSLET
jgi:hypothetical protein